MKTQMVDLRMNNIEDVIKWLEKLGYLHVNTITPVRILKDVAAQMPKPTKELPIKSCTDSGAHPAHIYKDHYCYGHSHDYT